MYIVHTIITLSILILYQLFTKKKLFNSYAFDHIVNAAQTVSWRLDTLELTIIDR